MPDESYKVKYEREHEENAQLRLEIEDMKKTILKRNKEIETLKRMLEQALEKLKEMLGKKG
ncbi:MAG: hypothetical protein IKH82_03765 [Clostridiales bacterium]|nr:hypothetical protein [Clostridiales bacterium]